MKIPCKDCITFVRCKLRYVIYSSERFNDCILLTYAMLEECPKFGQYYRSKDFQNIKELNELFLPEDFRVNR